MSEHDVPAERGRGELREKIEYALERCTRYGYQSVGVGLTADDARRILDLLAPQEARGPDIEALAEAVHDAYLATCARLGWDVKPANRVPYAELSEDSKELDRASVRAVLAGLSGRGKERVMTRSSQTEYERVAGVLEACADAEKRLGGHPYRAKIMRRSAELLRRADVLLRTPAEARQVLALDAIRDVLGIDYDEDSAMWYLPAEPAPIECATLDDALRAYAKMAAPVSGEPSGAEAVVREAWRSVTDSLPKPGADVIAGYRDTAGRWLSVRSVYAAARSVACTCERDGDCLCEMDDTGESWWPEGWYEVAENCDDDANAWRIGGTVTHWMPLPTPPGEEEGESDAE